MPTSPARLAAVAVLLAAAAGPAAAQTATLGYNWQGATWRNEGSGDPPDTHGSVGINHFVQAVNGGFQMYNKDGTGYSFPTNYISNNAFWTTKVGLTTGSATYTDPRIYYDPLSRRWFAVEITADPITNNRILIGRSDTADPTGTWRGITINSESGRFADYPTLGVDANGVYIGTNNFDSAGNFTGVSLLSVPKAQFTSAATQTQLNAVVSASSVSHGLPVSTYGFTPHGVTDTTGATTGATAGLVLGDRSPMTLARTVINNPGTAPTVGATANVGILSAPDPGSFATQSGGPTLDNGDGRLSSAIYRVGNLIYMSRTVNSTDIAGRSSVRWSVLSVNPATNAVGVVREGTVNVPSAYLFYPSIAANSRGDFVLSFSRSSASEFPGIWAVVGTTTDFSTWSVGAPVQLQAGQTFQNIGTGIDNRWGDYSATTLDPADPGSFWVTNEYMHNVAAPEFGVSAQENWATRVVEVIPTVAGEFRWKDAAAGSLATAAQWQTGTAPSATTDHVIFSRWKNASYTVTVPDSAAHDRLSVRQTGPGTVTFALGTGATWTLGNASAGTPSLAVAEFQGQANVAFSLGAGSQLNTRHTVVAGQAGAVGNLTVTGSSTATWLNQGDVYLGGTATAAGGTATLTVRDVFFTVGGTLKIWNTASSVTTANVNTFTVGGLTNGPGATPTVNLTGTSPRLIVNGDGVTVPNSTFDGTIAGVGSLNKSNAGTFTLTGANTYTGATIINANGGTLRLAGSGSIAPSPSITVGPGATFDVAGLTGGANFAAGVFPTDRFAVAAGQSLQGAGTVSGSVGVRNGGTVSPGTAGAANAGSLTVTGDVAFQASAATFRVNLDGTAAGTAHDRLTVVGAVVLNNAALDALLGSEYVPGPSDQLFIIDNDGTDAVVGTFNGLPQGASFALGGTTAYISYQGDVAGNQLVGGNDVVISFVAPVPEPATVLAVAAAGLGLGALARRRGRREAAA